MTQETMTRRTLEGCSFSRLRQLAEGRGLPPGTTLSSREELVEWLLAHPVLSLMPQPPPPTQAPTREPKKKLYRADPSLDGLCRCGCGSQVRPGNGYLSGHHAKVLATQRTWARIRSLRKKG